MVSTISANIARWTYSLHDSGIPIERPHNVHYIFNVRQSYCARYSYSLSVLVTLTFDLSVVCPSFRPSVTRWYCVETAQPIVKLSSLPSSPMIIVL